MAVIDSLRHCDLSVTGEPPVAAVEVAGTRVMVAVNEVEGRVYLRAEIIAANPPLGTPVEEFGLAAPGDTRFSLADGRLIGTRTLVAPVPGDLYDSVHELAKASCGLSRLLAAIAAPERDADRTAPASAAAQGEATAVIPPPRAEHGGLVRLPGAAPPGRWESYGQQQPGGPVQWTPTHVDPTAPAPIAAPGQTTTPYQATAPYQADAGRRLLATAMWVTIILAGLGVLAGLVTVIVPLATAVDGAGVIAAVGAGIVVFEAAFGVAAWFAGMRGRQAGRIVVTVLAGLTTAGGIANLLAGAAQGSVALLVGGALLVLWWVPPTTQAMQAKRSAGHSR